MVLGFMKTRAGAEKDLRKSILITIYTTPVHRFNVACWHMRAPQAWTPGFVNYTALAAALQLSLGRGIQECQKHLAIQSCHCDCISQDLIAF